MCFIQKTKIEHRSVRFSFLVVTHPGIEPEFPAWEASVLTAWPMGLVSCLNIITYSFANCKHFLNFLSFCKKWTIFCCLFCAFCYSLFFLKEYYKRRNPPRKARRISSFLCGFLVALDLSPVPLYGDDRPITPSASKWDSPFALFIRHQGILKIQDAS